MTHATDKPCNCKTCKALKAATRKREDIKRGQRRLKFGYPDVKRAPKGKRRT